MNSTIYRWLNKNPYIVGTLLIFDFILILLNLLLELLISLLVKVEPMLGALDKNFESTKRPLLQQIILFFSTLLTNFISIMVYDDYWQFSQKMLGVISVTQILSLLYYFLSSKSQATNMFLKSSLILGVLNIILTFTHIYFYLFCNYHTGFSNFVWVGMNNNNNLNDWLNCLFYSVSLVIPYSLTELIPNTFLFKFISLFQVGIFYIFIFNKLGEILHNHEK